ncbi:hypothetical protein DFS34DRAFT_297753 [Phlyctochytrium arcticum]|nr:hypothetical protein DFS34DRAFT_297753 [Phlyctochytrium arcticum]
MFASGLEERTVAYLEDNYERKSHSSEGAGHGSSGGLTEVGTGGTKKRALTARELVDMVHKSYTYVAQRVQNEVDISAEGYPYMGVDGHQSSNKQFNSTDQWIELCKSDTNKNFSSENKTGTNPCSRKPYPPIQPSPTRTSPVERGIFDRLPRTGDLLIQIARGRINITSIGYRMQPATDELLEHGMELVENIVGLFYPDGGHGASTPGHGQDGVSSDSSAQPSSPSPSRNAPMVFLPAHQPSEHPTTPTTAPTALAGGSGAPSPLGTFAARAAHSLATATIAIVFLLAVGLTYAFDLIFQWALFLATLYAFVSAEVGVVEYIGRIVGVVDPDEQLRIALSSAVQSALIVNLKLTLYHMLFTYLTHSVAGLPIVYIPVFVTALATLIPIVPWWVVALPAGGRLWWANAGTGGEEWGWMGGWGGVARAVALVGSHMIVAWVVDPAILEAELGGVVVPKSGLNTVPISPQVPPPANSTVPGSSFSATVEAGATRSSHPIKFSPYPASDTNTGTPPPQGPSLLLTGLAFWLGYDQFGFPLGLFLGPLIVTCVPIVMGHLYREYVVVDNVTFRKSSLASSADQIPAPLSGGGTGLDARPPPAFI